MNKLWKKFDKLTGECYSNMISSTPDKSVWDETFDVFVALVENEREVNPEFAQELYEIDDQTEFSHDVEGFIEDYIDELGMHEMYERLYEVCKKLLDMFRWKEDEPTDLRFELAEALKGQGRYEEAVAFCEKWHRDAAANQSEEAEQVSAAALVYAQLRVEEYTGAEEIIKKYVPEGAKCGEENEIIWRAAVRFYESKDEKKAKKMKKELEKYEAKVDRMLEKEFEEFGETLFGGDDWDDEWDDDWDDEWDMDDDELPFS